MPKVIITRPTRADGKSVAPSGDGKAVELSKAACEQLVAAGKARYPEKVSKTSKASAD